MKKFAIILFSAAFALTALTSAAFAGTCGDELKKATDNLKKDKQCQKDATNIAKAFGNQIKTCKGFRNLLKTCRKAKKAEKKDCRNNKRDCKKACAKGKKGSSCRKACRKEKAACTKSARETKRACKKEAKTTQDFAVCKDARKLTRKAAGTFFKCAAKHYGKAAGVCAKELLQSLNKD